MTRRPRIGPPQYAHTRSWSTISGCRLPVGACRRYADAEAALAEVLADDPDLEDVLYVAEVNVEISPN